MASGAAQETVRGLIEAYEHGEIDFSTLVSVMASHVCSELPRPKDWGEAWDRAEEGPDDDDPFWITLAGDLSVITEEEEDQLLDALLEVPGGCT